MSANEINEPCKPVRQKREGYFDEYIFVDIPNMPHGTFVIKSWEWSEAEYLCKRLNHMYHLRDAEIIKQLDLLKKFVNRLDGCPEAGMFSDLEEQANKIFGN